MKRLVLVCFTFALLTGIVVSPVATAASESTRKPEYDFWRHNYASSRVKDLLDVVSVKLAYNRWNSCALHVRAFQGAELGFTHFNGWKIGNEKCGFGVLEEQKYGGGIFVYPTWVKQNVFHQTSEAWERGLFYADLGLVPSVQDQKPIYYDAENRNWLAGAVEVELPLLPGFELGVDYGEAADFVLSWVPFVPGLRVPEPFTTAFDDEGRAVPKVNTYHWHGANQAEFEKY